MNPHLYFAEYFADKKLEPYLYLLSKRMAEGNVCLDLQSIDNDEDEFADFGRAVPLKYLKQNYLIGCWPQEKPFILNDDKLYFQRYFKYETDFIENIKRLISKTDTPQKFEEALQHQALIQSLYKTFSWQAVATLSAFVNNFQIITGGPGTGKTTSIAKLLALLFRQNPNTKVLLAAPTGKAAVRMAESLQQIENLFKKEKIKVERDIFQKIQELAPSTIHSMLGYVHDSIYFKHNAQNPLNADVVVVDECSMIDIALFAKLTNAIGNNTKLILLGDKNQLSSVEAGSLFGDLCSCLNYPNSFSAAYAGLFEKFWPEARIDLSASAHPLHNHLVELQHSHRFKEDSGIGKFSKVVLNNELQELPQFFENKEEAIVFRDGFSHESIEAFAKGYEGYIREQDIIEALKKINGLKILCAVKLGPAGVYAINEIVTRQLAKSGLIKPAKDFYENRLIMVTKNQPQLNLFNGDTGIIRAIDGQLRACFLNADGSLNKVLPAIIQQMETAYAITIHKSQGSEFDEVMIVLPEAKDSPVLNRELIYTAITRAKQKVFIVSGKDVLVSAMGRTVKRISGIINRLKS